MSLGMPSRRLNQKCAARSGGALPPQTEQRNREIPDDLRNDPPTRALARLFMLPARAATLIGHTAARRDIDSPPGTPTLRITAARNAVELPSETQTVRIDLYTYVPSRPLTPPIRATLNYPPKRKLCESI